MRSPTTILSVAVAMMLVLGAGNASASFLAMSQQELESERNYLASVFGAQTNGGGGLNDPIAGVSTETNSDTTAEVENGSPGTTQVPEPGILLLFSAGALGLGLMARRRTGHDG